MVRWVADTIPTVDLKAKAEQERRSRIQADSTSTTGNGKPGPGFGIYQIIQAITHSREQPKPHLWISHQSTIASERMGFEKGELSRVQNTMNGVLHHYYPARWTTAGKMGFTKAHLVTRMMRILFKWKEEMEFGHVANANVMGQSCVNLTASGISGPYG
ncbi:hypothetical protein OIV83_004653 [Microbotryomycetes sp. JL201]|nr:hypothetical protein OIV83_004653 [Microbotryomycetes sp. JL201]